MYSWALNPDPIGAGLLAKIQPFAPPLFLRRLQAECLSFLSRIGAALGRL